MGKALVVTSIDGLATVECGIASVVHWFFEEIDAIVEKVPRLLRQDWSLYAISPRIDAACSDFSPRVHALVSSACAEHGGEFLWAEVDDPSSLRAVWSLGDPRRWERMCASVAGQVRALAERHDQVTVLAHGIMLAPLRDCLRDLDRVQIVFVPHTLGPVFQDQVVSDRAVFEKRGFDAMAEFAQDRIGCIGPYFEEILRTGYGRTSAQLAPFVNGIPAGSFRFPAEVPAARRREHLERAGVPLDKRLVFSWGRCAWQKGFDALIPAWSDFRERSSDDWHCVLLMPQEVSAPEYVALLDEQLAHVPSGSCTVIRRFDPLLPYYLLREEALEIVVFASRFEGAPLSLLETLRFGSPGLRIAWHDIPSLAQFLQGAGPTFRFGSLERADMVESLLRARDSEGVTLPESRVQSFADNTARGLRDVLRWWT
ncbi:MULTISPECIES: glycosyltransferase [Streptomyces]|uniref:Glycosyl transferases group 1 n=1 Tax=Streptomyces chartreusis NRRL 3882 TaxID=1079985 RepID=A0A2N9B240_STRCX|nr:MULTISPECIES: glycosyltransferase [Streptomyces]MYS92338.1 hypothetical protein [Streptomyces sp. SID5464]SOR77402.1 Glycosyl transferases group 1 [Streptomyces chartreusis NRRL 3882]